MAIAMTLSLYYNTNDYLIDMEKHAVQWNEKHIPEEPEPEFNLAHTW